MPGARCYAVVEHLEARPLQPRRGWTDETKTRLVEERLELGANVSAIARREGVSPSQLFGWRKKAIEGGVIHHLGSDEEDGLSFARASLLHRQHQQS
nr:transposase [Phyllobacterium myrsinacearum]